MSTLELTQENLNQTIESNDVVLVDFWAEWCGPCKQFGPVFEEASEKHENVVFGKVDTEDQQQLAAAAGISSIPTLMAFREQTLVFAQPGALNGEQLDQVIDAVKALDMDEVREQIAQAEAEAKAKAEDGEAPAPGQA
ncbi:thioredoxin [Rothia sp. AR01]|uniref:Thioredoxin n=1 Tax=Rothia santali TaxID=2949643 RepID=A0A9X2HD96_9MICC|nr:thioredoxin [Rothia santali]MCP3424742.1 thioredoxin [Rothia santali]